jgi:energy-coupling factor transporter ATP-binding protein EcfA2
LDDGTLHTISTTDMKNRLELFREKIAAFDGAADPIHAIEKGYFTEEPHQSSTNALFKRISLRPQSKILLIGGIGSGKTTQLLRLQQLFQQHPDSGIYPHYIDVTEYTKPNDIQAGTLDAIIGLELISLLEKNGLQVDEIRRTYIKEFAYGSAISDRELRQLTLAATNITKNISNILPGVLSSRPRSADSLNRSVQVLASLVEDFQNKFKQTPYFLFDGLDRVDETENFTRMVSSASQQNTGIGFTIVGAASLIYSSFIDSIDGIFNHVEYRSAFDVEQDEEARTFFENVLIVRAGQGFSQEAEMQDLIRFSGGVLRDLVNLAQESIQEAYLADAETIEPEHVAKAVRSMGRAKMLGLDKERYRTLANLTQHQLETLTSPEEIYLLSSGRILEYRFPDRRFDIHPVLKELLVGSKGAKS